MRGIGQIPENSEEKKNLAFAGLPSLMKSKRGYIFTVSTFFLMSSVLILALFFSAQPDDVDLSGAKLSSLYDDVRGNLAELMNVSADYGFYENLTIVRFEENMPAEGIGDAMGEYEHFIERNYTSYVSTQVLERRGSMAAADINLGLDDTIFVLDPYDYIYEYNNLSKHEISVYPSGDTDYQLKGVAFNITPKDKLNATLADVNITRGGIPVAIYVMGNGSDYIFANQTNVSEGSASYWVFNISDGSVLNITAGRARGRADDSFDITLDGESRMHTEIYMAFQKLPYLSLDSGFKISIKDLLGYRPQNGKIIDKSTLSDDIWFSPDFTSEPRIPLEGIMAKSPYENCELMGFCVCEPCYWEPYCQGAERACESKPCPDQCGIERNMTFWPV